jgi:hypothetical protein
MTQTVAPPVEAHPRQESPPTRIGLGPFLSLALQLGLVLAVILVFRIELERGFAAVALLILIGFLIHSWLPVRARLPFFLLLTITAIEVLLPADGFWLVALGVGLLGLCHLPIAWSARVALVLTAATVLAALQAGWLQVPWAATVIPILAAMFMFRLVLYLYNLKTDETPASPWARVAYFFMLPNVCFPLFPVVDYKTFLRTYYDAPAAEIYQKGVYWMLRGVSHILLYRVINDLLPAANSLPGILGVYTFMAMTYALYLRVSGLFHLIAGSLCIFGFNLPVTNNHYFLASSFNDLWRRINIYWKDFMMTVVFYPVLMGLRRWGMSTRIALATGTVFLVTWFLHSYQWFWLQGGFPIRAADIAFWGFLGLAVALNSLWETRHGRRRRLGRPEWSLREALMTTGRTFGVFSTMAVLWSLWYSPSLREWGYRLLRVRYSDTGDWALFVALVFVVFLAGVGACWLGTRGWGLERVEGFAWRHASLLVPAISLTMLIVSLPFVHEQAGGSVARMAKKIQSPQLNRIDLDRQERGYYETLSRAGQFGPSIAASLPTADEGVLFRHSRAVRRTEDIRGYEIIPGAEVVFRGGTFRANRWGFRDREYEKAKPAGTYRVALLGSSHVMGWGVGNDQTFENLVEDRLNIELGSWGFERYEILNFAVAGYALPQMLYVAEHVIPQFEPDVVIYVAHPREGVRLIKRLQILVTRMGGGVADYEHLAQTLREADAHAELPPDEFEHRLAPFREDLLRWSYDSMVAAVRSYGAVPVLALVPLTNEDFEREELAQLSRLSQESGAILMVLPDPYGGHELERITVSDSDKHPNALGHRLVADTFYAGLLENAEALGLLPKPAEAISPES